MSWLKRLKPKSNYIAIYATLILFAILFLIGCALYPGFGSWQVVSNLFIDNAFLIVLSIGEMLTILTAGIDLSVGAMVALSV
jgi:simple sugar transport system permease protein